MRYSLYKDVLDGTNVYKLYLQTQDYNVMCYQFNSRDIMVSNSPGATRWFGKTLFCEDNYYLYPIEANGISVGNYNIVQLHEKFTKIKFETGLLQGEWYLRNIKGGEILFWKPTPTGFVCNMKKIDVDQVVQSNNGNGNIKIEQAFSSHLEIDSNEFSGPCMSAGIVTGMDRISTLFTDSFLKKFTKKLQAKMDDLIVDIDHDFIQTKSKELSNTGKITEIKLKENDKINYIWCKGQTSSLVPSNAGLSMTLLTEAVWDTKLNIWVAVDGEPIGIAITDKIQPACQICWVE